MSIPESLRYGAAELKRFYNRNLVLAFAVSIGFHLLLVGLYVVTDRVLVARPDDHRSYKLPPTVIFDPMDPPEATRPAGSKPSLPAPAGGSLLKTKGPISGIPDPRPDELVDSTKMFAPVQNLPVSSPWGTGDTGSIGNNPHGTMDGPIRIDSGSVNAHQEDPIPSNEVFVAVEQEPQFDLDLLYKRLKYPEMARKNNIEGRVTVQVFVDRKGEPRKYQIVQSDNKILEQSAIDAVMATHFSPAIQNKTPIGVWVTIPIVFKLN
jgi:protein TonB